MLVMLMCPRRLHWKGGEEWVECTRLTQLHSLRLNFTPSQCTQTHFRTSQLLEEVSSKLCDVDYEFAEEDKIIRANRYRGLCPCRPHTHYTPHSAHTYAYERQSSELHMVRKEGGKEKIYTVYKEGMNRWLLAVTSDPAAKGSANDLEVAGAGPVHCHFFLPPIFPYHV